MMKSINFLLIVAMITIGVTGCTTSNQPATHPSWTRNAVMYEVNTRQITPEGTFAALSRELPRLKEAGVDILWFMPIYPIGEVGRKGTLGSYYSIKDYTAVNPEFGTLADFQACVDKAHQLGMRVMLDWVAAHTSRDAVWLSHYDWYHRNEDGSPAYLYDWSDVARLNYDNTQMRQAMLDAMLFWLKEAHIDGFRCDMADLTPIDFWNWAVPQLKQANPDLFMLAESESPAVTEQAFDAFYAWTVHHTLNSIARGEKNVDSLRHVWQELRQKFGPNAVPLLFTSNHDENSWSGSEYERMGGAVRQMAVLTHLLPGMPLIYTGQEVGNRKRLAFFEKDTVSADAPLEMTAFYKTLTSFKKASPALAEPPYGGMMEELTTDYPAWTYAFKRCLEEDCVLALFNFSAEAVTLRLVDAAVDGTYVPMEGGDALTVSAATEWYMEPYGYKVYKIQK